jgi:uncharacterized protein
MLDLWLMTLLGFLGSFGHCLGMCGPLTVAFSLSQHSTTPATVWRSLQFHTLLNLGRIISYASVGEGIRALGSVLVAGGQFAGIDSFLRRGLTSFTGSLSIWMGLAQLPPTYYPNYFSSIPSSKVLRHPLKDKYLKTYPSTLKCA